MLIIDTHIWIKWIIEGGKTLPPSIIARLESEDRVCISAVSCLEVAWLVRNGRIELPMDIDQWIQNSLEPAGIECLPVTCRIAQSSAELPQHHKDPSDRIIIATAIAHNSSLASLDGVFPAYKEISSLLVS
jgi:PIN domain nuclease of toxin-antitoxin system